MTVVPFHPKTAPLAVAVKPIPAKIVDALLDPAARGRIADQVFARSRAFAEHGDRVGLWKRVVEQIRERGRREGASAGKLMRGMELLSAEVKRRTEEREKLLDASAGMSLDLGDVEPTTGASVVEFPGENRISIVDVVSAGMPT